MPNEINIKGLKTIDRKIAAEKLKCSRSLISMVLKGQRKDKKGIVATLIQLVESRERWEREVKK